MSYKLREIISNMRRNNLILLSGAEIEHRISDRMKIGSRSFFADGAEVVWLYRKHPVKRHH